MVNTEIVLFDQAAEFPVATALPREPRARVIALVAGLQRWLTARWQWFRPRTVPCIVAVLGMVAILKAADYLANQHVKDTTWILPHQVGNAGKVYVGG